MAASSFNNSCRLPLSAYMCSDIWWSSLLIYVHNDYIGDIAQSIMYWFYDSNSATTWLSLTFILYYPTLSKWPTHSLFGRTVRKYRFVLNLNEYFSFYGCIVGVCDWNACLTLQDPMGKLKLCGNITTIKFFYHLAFLQTEVIMLFGLRIKDIAPLFSSDRE